MKGQTAVEYLMTYGWAILIILIVAGVLAYYGIFAPAGFLGPTARGFGQIQALNPWSLSASTGTIVMSVGNRVGGTVTFEEISYTTDSGTTQNLPIAATSNVTLTSGSNGVISATGTGAIAGKNAGDTYTATVIIKYMYGGQNFTSSGTLSGTYS
jgi:hypothetical protein